MYSILGTPTSGLCNYAFTWSVALFTFDDLDLHLTNTAQPTTYAVVIHRPSLSLSLSPLSIVLYLACSCVALRRGDWPKNRFVKFSRCLSFRSQHRSWGFCLRGQQSRRAAHQSRVLLMGLLGFLLGASLSSSTITTVGGAQGLPADAFTQSSGCQICLTLLFRSCCASWLHSTALLLFKHSCTLQPCTRYCCPTLRMYQKWGMEIYNFIFLLHHIISSCTMLILGRFAF